MGRTDFEWSSDGGDWKAAGESYRLTWGRYRGDRTGLFTYNERGGSGTAVFLQHPQSGDRRQRQ